MTPTEINRLETLIQAQLAGELDSGECEELARMLDSSSEARQRFVELAEFESALTSIHREPNIQGAEYAEAPPEHLLSKQEKFWKIAPWIAVAACLLLLLVPKADLPTDSPDQSVARLLNEVGSSFAKNTENRFHPGSYQLNKGTIHLGFINGAELVIEAPASFHIRDEKYIRLDYGKVRAMISPEAQGFTIATREANFEDLGTEFALQVDPQAGAGTIHVFEGLVNVRHPQSNQLIRSLTDGERGGFLKGEATTDSPETFQAENLPAPGRIGLKRWQASHEKLLTDPDLIGCYFFQRDPQCEDTLINSAGSSSDAIIKGARWVTGRWPGKQALLFDSDTDFAEFEIPGDYSELSIAAWLLVDRLDYTLNAVVDSNNWQPGDIHLQINRFGYPYVDVAGSRIIGAVPGWASAVIKPREWVHLATTISLDGEKAFTYVNGQKTGEFPMRETGLIRPSTCRIGNWQSNGSDTRPRAFKGRIDELVIWNRAIDAERIMAEVERGRPSMDW